jgi:hypothetical protein
MSTRVLDTHLFNYSFTQFYPPQYFSAFFDIFSKKITYLAETMHIIIVSAK